MLEEEFSFIVYQTVGASAPTVLKNTVMDHKDEILNTLHSQFAENQNHHQGFLFNFKLLCLHCLVLMVISILIRVPIL